MSHEDVRCALADGRPVSKWRNGHSPDVGTTVRTYDRDEVWYGTVMVEVCEGAPVAVSGWVLTDRHDLGPCAASSLHRVTISVIRFYKTDCFFSRQPKVRRGGRHGRRGFMLCHLGVVRGGTGTLGIAWSTGSDTTCFFILFYLFI